MESLTRLKRGIISFYFVLVLELIMLIPYLLTKNDGTTSTTPSLKGEA
jgi:hypothetical protein